MGKHSPPPRPCGTCGGAGFRNERIVDKSGIARPHRIPCNGCGGKGFR